MDSIRSEEVQLEVGLSTGKSMALKIDPVPLSWAPEGGLRVAYWADRMDPITMQSLRKETNVSASSVCVARS